MNAFRTVSRPCASFVLFSFCVLAALPSSASATGGSTLMTFEELDKGATSHFVDNPPKATLHHGVASVSPGDTVLLTNPLAMEGKVVGKIRIACTATGAGSTKNLAAAGFVCTAIAKIPGGSLVFATELSERNVEGAVTGGTGAYAGARGTFVSSTGKGVSTLTITLLE